MPQTRDNHYVPQWYQRGFLFKPTDQLCYLDLTPDKIMRPDGTPVMLPDGTLKTHNSLNHSYTSQCFYQTDLYTTFFGPFINDEIEKKLFGEIDNTGSKAVWAFISEDVSEWHNHFSNFFIYIDSQKIRTPKGLDWIKNHYPGLEQNELMREMQGIRNMHCTIWTEGVREIVSSKNANVKFILSDHPVTIYNHACSLDNEKCIYPNDPAITLKGSQTIFPLDKEHCLILTNYEYAKNPESENPTEKRTFARHNRNSMVRTDAFIRTRFLNDEDVKKINLIIKTRAKRYIAAAKKEWLYPEKEINLDWSELRHCLLPPKDQLWNFGGEMYAGFNDGSTYYQDAFGRTRPENEFLKKPKREDQPKPNEYCPCGYGKKFKKCCFGKSKVERPSWEELSIRERNIIFYNGITDILGMNKDKTWDDVRKELSDDQVKKIYELYGFLWPPETDIISLLPKPDKNLRAVYTGIIDPRVIPEFATSLTAYFDEILIQNPFVNHNVIKPEFNPVDNPHQYKQQTLKNIILFMTLMPFIEEGYINLFPDPCAFDGHLQRQMFNMAEERSKKQRPHERDSQLMEWLHKDDFERTIGMFPKTWQEGQIRKALPNLTDSEIQEMIEYIEEKKKSDPLALLQEDIYSKGGQLTSMSLVPNFEITLFLCQATGALLLTDSHYRWAEIEQAQNKDNGIVIYNWNDLVALINSFEYSLNGNYQITFQLRKSGKLGEIRKAIKEIYMTIRNDNDPRKIDLLIETLKEQYEVAYKTAEREIKKEKENENNFQGKFRCLIPQGGIVHNNVQRMLLTCGNDNHMKNVPMAILVEHSYKET